MTDAPTPLVTLDEAKAHLKIEEADEDTDLQLKLDGAIELVVDYCDTQDPIWSSDTVPARVKSAILLVLGNLYGSRGDKTPSGPPISQNVEDLLYKWHTPALA